MNLLNFHKTKFLKSYAKVADIDIQDGIEIAFFGCSNSGKSSAINALTNQNKLARCSKLPGRTQLINFFEVSSDFRIVDLPGYGYSKVSLLIKNKLKKIIYNYLKTRKQLKCLILLMDIRYPFKTLDQKIINIAMQNKIFVLVLLSKCDKVKIYQQNIQFKKVYEKLNLLLKNFFQIQLFSSHKKIGIRELEQKLNHWYNKYISFTNI